tara:strand:- start:318 stop:506 length:189 start_codon:yes stop_codon:yes gene_type:complete
MKNVSETPTTPKQELKRTKVIRSIRIAFAGFLSLLVWGLHFIGKFTAFLEDILTELRNKFNG